MEEPEGRIGLVEILTSELQAARIMALTHPYNPVRFISPFLSHFCWALTQVPSMPVGVGAATEPNRR
jgi:hypothetical protein